MDEEAVAYLYVYEGVLFSHKQEGHPGVPIVAQWLTNLTSIQEDVGSIPGLSWWVKDLVGCRRSTDPMLLWLWLAAVVSI